MADTADGVQVLVTGASGFIATHVVKQLQEAGYRVRGTVRSTGNENKIAPLRQLCPNAKYPIELVEADLSKEAGWEEAVNGCEYVMHVASPFPIDQPRNEDEVIKPAVDGTLHVMRACAKAGTVKRLVLTSSVAAISGGFSGGEHPYNEENWTDVSNPHCTAYTRSKALAEKAAWDFLKELPDDQKFELAVINPVFVVGPVLCGGAPSSAAVMKRILERQMPLLPNLNMAYIDVRDIATAHMKAMTLPEAAHNRHIISSSTHWLQEVGEILAKEFKPQGYKPTTSTAPDCVMKFMAFFDSEMKGILPGLSKITTFDTTRMRTVLGITPIDIDKSLIDMAYSMIENGMIPKTAKYKGRE